MQRARKYDKIIRGSVAEWLKAHDSKSCGQKCLGGSNPLASAKFKDAISAFKKDPAGSIFLIILTRHSLVGHDFLSLVVAFSYLGKVIDGNSAFGNNAFISVGVDIK